MLTSRWVGALVAAAVLGLTGCGTVREPIAAGTAGTPARSASSSSAPTGPSAGRADGHLADPVPAGFAATSVTWVSPDEGFVLGTAPCAHAPCTSIARTRNRGVSWTGLPAPAVPVGAPGQVGVVWGIRFATPEHGFVFGEGLWETTEGGRRWSRVRTPFGSVLSLAIDGGTLAATSTGQLAIATESAASWLFYSPDAGAGWQIVNQQDDGGQGWADLGFTTATDGVVVRGPADSDGNSSQRPGQFLTDDAGASWYRISF